MQIAIIRGTEDKLRDVGMESLLSGAEMVIEVPGHSDCRISDRYGQTNDIRYVEVDTPEQVLVECMTRIKRTWEDTHRQDDNYLGHAAAGTWFFYWFSPQMLSMSALLARGDVDELRAAATDYIDSEFGAERGPTLDQDQLEDSECCKAETLASSLSHI